VSSSRERQKKYRERQNRLENVRLTVIVTAPQRSAMRRAALKAEIGFQDWMARRLLRGIRTHSPKGATAKL
jgi:hypothetical protein